MFWFKNAKGLLVLFLLVIFSCSSVFAQTVIMEYGFVDTSDLKMTTCAIDREAPAMFLFDTGELWYMSRMGRYFNTRIKRHVRIKILKDNGLKWANVKLYYENYKSYEVIENLRGITYNLSPNGDIETVPLEAVNIYDKPINKYVSSVVFSMPNVKVGSIIEYEYELQRDDDEDISEWSFQDIIPTRFSRFDIRIPQYYEFTTQSDKLFPIEIKDSVRKESAVLSNKLEFYKSYEKIYNASNIPGFVDEPMMATHGKRYQSIRFQFSGYKGTFYRYGILNSWPEFAKALFKDNDYIEQ